MHRCCIDDAIFVQVITRPASMRVAEYAFQYARDNGRKRVTAVHKAVRADGNPDHTTAPASIELDTSATRFQSLLMSWCWLLAEHHEAGGWAVYPLRTGCGREVSATKTINAEHMNPSQSGTVLRGDSLICRA